MAKTESAEKIADLIALDPVSYAQCLADGQEETYRTAYEAEGFGLFLLPAVHVSIHNEFGEFVVGDFDSIQNAIRRKQVIIGDTI